MSTRRGRKWSRVVVVVVVNAKEEEDVDDVSEKRGIRPHFIPGASAIIRAGKRKKRGWGRGKKKRGVLGHSVIL
jgi:hypothetical protein